MKAFIDVTVELIGADGKVIFEGKGEKAKPATLGGVLFRLLNQAKFEEAPKEQLAYVLSVALAKPKGKVEIFTGEDASGAGVADGEEVIREAMKQAEVTYPDQVSVLYAISPDFLPEAVRVVAEEVHSVRQGGKNGKG